MFGQKPRVTKLLAAALLALMVAALTLGLVAADVVDVDTTDTQFLGWDDPAVDDTSGDGTSLTSDIVHAWIGTNADFGAALTTFYFRVQVAEANITRGYGVVTVYLNCDGDTNWKGTEDRVISFLAAADTADDPETVSVSDGQSAPIATYGGDYGYWSGTDAEWRADADDLGQCATRDDFQVQFTVNAGQDATAAFYYTDPTAVTLTSFHPSAGPAPLALALGGVGALALVATRRRRD